MRHFIARSVIGLWLASGIAAGCGGADLVQPGPQGPPKSAVVLSFAAIAGTWSGTLNDNGGPVFTTIVLQEKADTLAEIGTVDYKYPPSGDGCGGVMLARSAAGIFYSAFERITYGRGCVDNGTTYLKHNTSDQTLFFEWYTPSGKLQVTGILTRN